MIRELELSLAPEEDGEEGLRRAAALSLGISPERIFALRPLRRVIDARRGRVQLRYRLRLSLDEPAAPPPPWLPLPQLKGSPVLIVGAGPAGLYAAYTLARRGLRSIILEQGPDVRGRRRDLALLNREGLLNPESNYCFGEGGAGTFSDGKLYTRAHKRGPVAPFLELLVRCGAPERILWDARPHIGTNRLPKLISAWRGMLEEAGVEVFFAAGVKQPLIRGGRVLGVELRDGRRLEGRALILAPGHSARPLFERLYALNIAMEPKAFALGVRVEHPQEQIDRIQYGRYAAHPALGAASYRLSRTQEQIGVYSFCMCPGGMIVPAATEQGGLVLNGMSPSSRGGSYANSGMVVSVGPQLYGEGTLAGMRWQRMLEQRAFQAGGGAYQAPAQRMTDFLKGRISSSLPNSSYRPGVQTSDLNQLLPESLRGPLKEALRFFDARKMRGYLSEEALMLGLESRSSAPLRILRDPKSLESPSHPGLFPCGEGAGYAGGILSAALDGARVAEAVFRSDHSDEEQREDRDQEQGAGGGG